LSPCCWQWPCGLLSPGSAKPKTVSPPLGAGELRISTINSPLIYATINGKTIGLDYELAQQFADYLGVKLKITVRQNISQLFDDLDNDDADMLAAGLVYNSERSKTISRARPTIPFRSSWFTASATCARARWPINASSSPSPRPRGD
jgi:ABC-type amino acid transport substrate-binding protein